MTSRLAAIEGGGAAGGPVGRLWRRLRARWRPAPIVTTDALKIYLEERAALIAQKCAIDYCRGKTGLASYALFHLVTVFPLADPTPASLDALATDPPRMRYNAALPELPPRTPLRRRS